MEEPRGGTREGAESACRWQQRRLGGLGEASEASLDSRSRSLGVRVSRVSRGSAVRSFLPRDANLSPVKSRLPHKHNITYRNFKSVESLDIAFLPSNFAACVALTNHRVLEIPPVVRWFVSCPFGNCVSARVCPVCRSVWMRRRKRSRRDCREDVPPWPVNS